MSEVVAPPLLALRHQAGVAGAQLGPIASGPTAVVERLRKLLRLAA
jgi:hypothetical protein